MADVITCPNCTQSVSADNEFCIFCGTKLPAVEKASVIAPVPSPKTGIVQKCKNGHEFTDNMLTYCPICGLPFEEIKTPPTKMEETWKCRYCGNMNSIDANYCEKCGKSKEIILLERKTEKTVTESTNIPEGMYTPTADDLKPKRLR